MVQLRYALKRDGVLDNKTTKTLRDAYAHQEYLEESGFESGALSPKSEVKRVIVVVLPQWITRFIRDRV